MSQAVIASNKSVSINKFTVNFSQLMVAGNASNVYNQNIFTTTVNEYIELYFISEVDPFGEVDFTLYSVDLNAGLTNLPTSYNIYAANSFTSGTGSFLSKGWTIPPNSRLDLVGSAGAFGSNRTVTLKIIGTKFVNSP